MKAARIRLACLDCGLVVRLDAATTALALVGFWRFEVRTQRFIGLRQTTVRRVKVGLAFKARGLSLVEVPELGKTALYDRPSGDTPLTACYEFRMP